MIYCFLLFNIMFENVLSLVIDEIRFNLFLNNIYYQTGNLKAYGIY